jgi:HEAT repeat protein
MVHGPRDTSSPSPLPHVSRKTPSHEDVPAKPGEPSQPSADESILKTAKLATDDKALLDFFRQRTLTDEQRVAIQALIKKLGDNVYKVREKATAELVARGSVATALLLEATHSRDPEVVKRSQLCLKRISEKDYSAEVAAAAARLIAQRKPEGAVEVLLDYLPFTDNESLSEELLKTLTVTGADKGKPVPTLVKALADKEPRRRGAAAEALCRIGLGEHKDAVRKLLQDSVPAVRLQVALALALARQKDAIPVLIDLLPQLPQAKVWRAEDVLFRLADGQAPPSVSMGGNEATRQKCRDIWAKWWKENAAKVDLARLSSSPPLLGYTLIILLDENIIRELGPDKQVRWEINNVLFPLDAQVLPGNRVLVAEYQASRVTERNHKGEVVWERKIAGPLAAQRLANGNTFIASAYTMMEVDKNEKEVFTYVPPPGERILKAYKALDGNVVCLTGSQVNGGPHHLRRLDSSGKELGNFPVTLGTPLSGGRIQLLPNGHILLPHNAENKVVEYDAGGTVVWEVKVEQPIAATRLSNGNTLVTSMNQLRAVEFDRKGNEVWEYRQNTRVTRAVRR